MLRVLILCAAVGPAAPMGETERVEEWTRRGYASPPRWTPATPGWKRVMDRRAAQLYALGELARLLRRSTAARAFFGFEALGARV